jgi:serine/threonine protein kinase
MGRVYVGWRQDDPSIRVAIKTPLSSLNPDHQRAFLEEARAALRVAGPQVVAVVDWGTEPAFIAFEFVEGGTLDLEIRRRVAERLPWSEHDLSRLFRQLVSAMIAINASLVHRDLKPPNIFHNQKGEIKVGDFGIAKYIDELTRTLTFKGWGSLPYMAPEALSGGAVDWRADQYSLGVVFFEMATFQHPFVGDEQELIRKHHYERPPRITQILPLLSERLATLVATMLEKRADDRYQSWGALDDALVSIQEGSGMGSSPVREDPLASLAAARIEAVRAKELEQEQRETELNRRTQQRIDLAKYWSDIIFAPIKTRVSLLNRSLPEPLTIRTFGPSEPVFSIEVGFLAASFSIWIEALPGDGPEDILAWGRISTASGLPWIGNLYLSPLPIPYGTWLEVKMTPHPLYQQGVPTDTMGGTYRVLGPNILAMNWMALEYQRSKKRVASQVQYFEKPIDFTSVVDECFANLIRGVA